MLPDGRGDGAGARGEAPPRARPVATVASEIAAAATAVGRRGALDTWAALAGMTSGDVWLRKDEPAGDRAMVQRFRRAIRRQAAGEPRATSVGVAGFRTLDLSIDRRVLIPRPETEGLVEQVLAWGRRRAGSWGTAVDVGTGSGAIALALAVEGAFERVVATDLSRRALAVARSNLASIDPPTPVELRHGSLLDPLAGEPVDVIVSNPPYLTTAEWRASPPSVRDFEPRMALDGGADGMDLIRQLLRDTRRHVRPGGLVALEIDSRRGAATLRQAREAGWRDAAVVPDVFGRDRFLLATRE